jgi:hypothetical protein
VALIKHGKAGKGDAECVYPFLHDCAGVAIQAVGHARQTLKQQLLPGAELPNKRFEADA